MADLHQVKTPMSEAPRMEIGPPHPESLEMAEVGFAAWAEGLSDDASDLIAPDAGEEVRWTADHGWVSPDSIKPGV